MCVSLPLPLFTVLKMACFGSGIKMPVFARKTRQPTLIDLYHVSPRAFYCHYGWKSPPPTSVRRSQAQNLGRFMHNTAVAARNNSICRGEALLQRPFAILQEVQNDFKTTEKVPEHAFNVSAAIRCSPALVNLSMVSIKQVI